MDGTPNIADLVITPDILKFVSGIDEFKGAWRAIGRIAPERLSALRRVATIESAASSTRIEGAKLTDREVELLLSNLDIKSFTSRDEQEVAGYADAMEMVFTSWEAIDLTRMAMGDSREFSRRCCFCAAAMRTCPIARWRAWSSKPRSAIT